MTVDNEQQPLLANAPVLPVNTHSTASQPSRLSGWLRRAQRGVARAESTLLFGLAILLGIITSGGVVLFRSGIDFFTTYFRAPGLHLLGGLGPLAIVPVLGVGGLLVGAIMDHFIGQVRHHGVAGIIESATYAGGRLRYWRMPLRVTMAALSLGAGASGGPEDPSVQIGANLGSMLGQWLHLSDERMRLLLAAGAASGIAAAFHAPIAGVFFALEVILGDFSTGAFGVVVLAAVVSAAVAQAIAPSGPELGIHTYTLSGLGELPLYALLGGLLAFVSALFIRFYYWQQTVWHHIQLPVPIRTGLAGVVVGLIAVFLPQVMSTGTDTLNLLLNGNASDYTLLLLAALAVGKIVATSISLGGGFVGGVFAPSLFVGATLGSAFGRIIHSLLPGFTSGDPAAYAMAGMAAVMTGVIRSPITAVLLLFELTDDYRLIIPLMLSTATCLILAEWLAPDGIYQLALARKGVRIKAKRPVALLQTVTVSQVMMTNPPRVSEDTLVGAARELMTKYDTHGLLVTDKAGQLSGVLTLYDLTSGKMASSPDRWTADAAGDLSDRRPGTLPELTVGAVCTREPLTITPQMTVGDALQQMSARDLGRLPVVSEADPRHIVGLLRRRDVMRAYDLALTRQNSELQALRKLIEAG